MAAGKLKELSVFGNNYPTNDGTGIRDYIHVVDLPVAHIKALDMLSVDTKVHIYNLGTGQGYSVLEIVEAFEKASCNKIPYKIVYRRAGDIASCYADSTLAHEQLGWTAKPGLQEMCEDTWRWQLNNSS